MPKFIHELVSTARCLMPWTGCVVMEVGYNLPLPITFSAIEPVVVRDDDGIISNGEA
ncbi:MAG: hypothetical protein HGA77_04725 [Chlorobiaceae bacterium]|nr:hypothetical protein [Chlorobiaceae bacterium]